MANIRKINNVNEYNEVINTEGKIVIAKFFAGW